ncbi:MAG: dTDP-4-dehydrorhamnose 3,5-epimerase family protein [Candidatus Binatia bacterium]
MGEIEGVIVRSLRLVPNARGRLMEVQRRDDPYFPGFGQVYVTETFPGVIKAWYRHDHQVDQIAAISGLVKLALFDDRPGSASAGKTSEIVLGELAPKLVLIPCGVWHGFQALGGRSAFLLHLNSEPFSADRPDEERRPLDHPGMPDVWRS